MVYFENLVFRFSQGLQIVEGVACSVHVTRQHVGKRKGLRRLLLKDRARLRLAIIGRIMMRLALLLLLQLLVYGIVALVVIALLLFPAEANEANRCKLYS